MAKSIYFAYGSNLDEEQMASRCPHARVIGPATLLNHTLVFSGNSPMWEGAVATVVPARRQRVQGLLWRVTRTDIKALDLYEGWPEFYGRKSFSVVAPGGDIVDVFAYFIPSKLLRFAPPSGLYLDAIMEAYAKWGFDFSPLLRGYE